LHSSDYSDRTARLVDEEVERILREQEERASKILKTHLPGLVNVAHALLERETISGADVAELVDKAFGKPVHPEGKKNASIAKLEDFRPTAGLPVAGSANHSTVTPND